MCQMCAVSKPKLNFANIETDCRFSSVEIDTSINFPQSALPIDRVESGDAAASTATTSTISINERFEGNLSSPSDKDWIKVNLDAGESYVVTAFGSGYDGINPSVRDTVLTVYDSSGNVVGSNDHLSTSNAFSLVEFTANAGGTYYLEVKAGMAYGSIGASGNYRVELATNNFSIDNFVTQMTEAGWGVPFEIKLNSSSGAADPTVNLTVNFNGLSETAKGVARDALKAWEAVSKLRFTESTSSSANIIFSEDGSGAEGGASGLYNLDGTYNQATVNVPSSWLDPDSTDYAGTEIGTYGYLTYLHEIGHALGLSHPGPYNYSGSDITYSQATFNNDSYQKSVMTYFYQGDAPGVDASNALPVMPMPADIAAIASLYGAPTNINGGDSVWKVNGNLDTYHQKAFNALLGVLPVSSKTEDVTMAMVDTGGTDTIDLSNQRADMKLDLRAEAASDVAGLKGNLVMAQGTVIENAIGGAGADTLIGNDVANSLSGGAGDDTLTGGAGDDTLNGGEGSDTAVLGVAFEDVQAAKQADGSFVVSSSEGRDVLIGIESVKFTDQTVAISALGNVGAGDQTLAGTADADTLVGGEGDDTLSGGRGHDSLTGGDGDDYLTGDSGSIAEDALSAQVVRMYLATLGRTPDLGGLKDWLGQIKSGAYTLLTAADGFTGSAEFLEKYGTTTNEQFVTLLYKNVLGRSPDEAGLSGWVDLLEGGTSRAQVVLGFSESGENVVNQRPVAQQFSESGIEAGWGDDVFRLYQATLGRAPDFAGFEGWAKVLSGDQPYNEVIAGFTGSAEFKQRFDVESNEDFLGLLYQNVLGRDPTEAEVQNWLDVINSNNLDWAAVTAGFAQSAEFIRKSAQSYIDWMKDNAKGDYLDGGAGNNILTGGLGSDSFVFDATVESNDTILDIEAWDKVVLHNSSFDTGAAALAAMTDSSKGAVLVDGSSTILFAGETVSDLSADLFHFA